MGTTIKASMAALAAAILLSACTPYGHWGNYGWWLDNCPGFPSREEVEQVLSEREEFIEYLKEERLIHFIDVSPCPEGVFLTINPIASKAQVLAVLDEHGARSKGLTMFYGVPFRFLRL